MNIVLVGMNHDTAPLEIRERLALCWGDGAKPLSEIMKIPQVAEAMVLSTCNRLEILAHADEPAAAIEGLKAFLLSSGVSSGGPTLTPDQLDPCLYLYLDQEAVRHLFRVASSLDSMVMGEPQILGQVKEAYRRCVQQKTSGVILNRLLHHAFRAAKRVRTETGIANNAVSVSFAAVELAKTIFGDLEGKTVLLIGAGEMSELAARHLLSQGVSRIIIANRTFERAVQLAKDFQGAAISLDRLSEALREADIVISSTGASEYVVRVDMITAALRRRKNRLLFLIDIAVPRDIDPAAGEVDNVYLYNIDDLQGIVDENLKSRRNEAEKAEQIIAEEVLKFAGWLNTLEAVPSIVSLRKKMQEIARGELEKSSSWMKNLSEEERENVEILAASLLNKILHDPITALKEECWNGAAIPYIAAVRRLFKLDEE
jgi:glutamyl-tRNA reductase